ncbi:hypothetical protein [Aeromonas veronii]|uniref:hypothetical protein n=1 Tax=Aeromonas TaxID=642 RepID=UPI00224FA074|nr:hypothetical protein [Aeromonas veronii]MCX4046693.1 hypothetical protein [Aeromonas veronii]HDN9007794.1 hypothetical protein [Aeromonas veronii]
MKPVVWLLLGLLSAMPVCAQSAPATVTAETLQTHQRYLAGRLQQGQFAAIDSLLATLSREQREFLLLQLLRDIPATAPASPALQLWVEAQADKAPEWLQEQQVDGFLVQQPVYDFAAQARQLLGEWQLHSLVQRYRQQLAQGSFPLKSIYYSSNPDLAMQQQALLLALDALPQSIWMREAQALASRNIYLPDNQLLLHLLLRTGEPALYGMLWRRPADQDALRALATINRFHHGNTASSLLIAASGNPGLREPALRQLSALSPLPPQAQKYLLAELSNRQYGALVAGLLMEVDEPQLLSGLARRLGQRALPPAAPSLLPDSGTPDEQPGL